MAPQIDALAARGGLTADEARHHPSRHTLREAVMGEPMALIDEGKRRLIQGATLLLCSDGVESLPHERIASMAAFSVGSLIDAVVSMKRPHQDNVTVIKLDQKS